MIVGLRAKLAQDVLPVAFVQLPGLFQGGEELLGSGRVMAVALELGNDHHLFVDVFLAFGGVPFGVRQLSLQICTALCVHAPS